MKKTFRKKAAALFLSLAVCLSGLAVQPNNAKAAVTYKDLFKTSDTATANVQKDISFNVPSTESAYLEVIVGSPVAMKCQVASATETLYNVEIPATVSDTAWLYDSDYKFYYYPISWNTPSVGDYTLSLTFANDTVFEAYGIQKKESATINTSTAVLTKGFTKQLKVSGAKGKIKWTSSKKSVATVSASGLVTAKSVGTAKITATTEDGQTLTCSINVKANAYTRSHVSPYQVTYGTAVMNTYNVSYNKKGDIVIKAEFVNNSGKTANKLKSIKFTVKTSSNKTIGTYTLKSKSVNIASGSSKSFTFTIKKSKLKLKKTQDLRNAKVNATGKFYYTVYTYR